MGTSEKWWVNYPWRMVQTNLPEIDMEDIDAVTFAKELKDFNANVVAINAAGILASYETELPFHTRSEYLKGDSLNKIIDECHKVGIRVIARCDFSKISHDLHMIHPDWSYRQADGTELEYNGFVQTCVNGEYQQKKVYDIVEEVFKTHDFDGIFCNMSSAFVVDYELNLHEPCHCDNCKKMFSEQFGMDIPDKTDPRNPAFGKYMMFINGCIKKQKQKMYDKIKAINENIAVNGFDYFRTECNQDINHHAWVYDASSNSRRIAGPLRDKVVDDASADYMAFQYRHSGISPQLLENRQWQNLAYTSSTSLYMFHSIGKHKDQSTVKASKPAYDLFAKYEDLYLGQKSKADTLLLAKPLMGRNDPENDGLVEMLTESHVLFDEAKIGEVNAELLKRYKNIVLADVSTISDDQAVMLDEFVEHGGVLVATGQSGCSNERRMPREHMALKCLGIDAITEKRKCRSAVFAFNESDKATFKVCAELESDMIVPGKEVVVGTVKGDTETYMTMVPEQPFGPPEICYTNEVTEIAGVYKTSYGKGYGVYVPFMIGTFYYEYGYDNSFSFMRDVLINVANIKSIAPDVTPMCEITVSGKDDMTMIHLINNTGCFGNNRFFKAVPLYDLKVELQVAENATVRTLNGGNVTIERVGEVAIITLDKLDSYNAIIVE